MAECLICNREHSAEKHDAVSCGLCKTCGMALCGKRLTMESAGKLYAFCCKKCMSTYRRMARLMRKRLKSGEISEREFQRFDSDVLI